MSTEFNVGSLVGTYRNSDFVGNNDSIDSYAFSLSRSENVKLSLTELSANADLRLFRASTIDGSFETVGEIARSASVGTADTVMSQALMPGLYVVQIEQQSGNTNYSLEITTSNPNHIYDVNSLTSAQTFADWVGTGNTHDAYKFRLNAPSNLSLTLNGMSQDADLRVGIDRNGNNQIDPEERLGSSHQPSSQAEAINITGLAAGNYLVEVYQVSGNTHYRLGMSATATNQLSSGVDLTGQFTSVTVPDIRLVNHSSGRARISVTNQGFQTINGPVTVNLYASTNQRYDSNDEWLASRTLNINLRAGQSRTFDMSFGAPTVVAPGSYYFLAHIDANQTVRERNEANNLTTRHVSAPGTDVILDWNATLLNAIQESNVPPPLAARQAAIVQSAVHDAVVAINHQYAPLYIRLDHAPTLGADVRAAAATAAYVTLNELFPASSLRAEFNAQLARSLSERIANPWAIGRGMQIGQAVAQQMLTLRRSDGFNATEALVPYGAADLPGSYQPTNLDGNVLLPKWGDVTPFAIDNASAWVPHGLPTYGTADYAVELNEVQSLGGINSTTRTGEQSEIAKFWSYDRPDTFRPPAQWNQIAQFVSLQAGSSLVTNARMLALLNIAQADAGIVAWKTKYIYQQLRPITAVHQADDDGTPLTTSDADWDSFLPTPPFPDYISGHATFGGAAAAVLAAFYGDSYSFDVTSQDLPGIYRHYDSFRQAADENGASRLYGGVHVRSANEDGVTMGYEVANYVLTVRFA